MNIPRDLLDGYRRFRREHFVEWAERYRALAAGQQPTTMLISCADSRVDPATIFSAGPGELFVLRNVAAIVPPCEEAGQYHGTSAAIEFGVSVLQVSTIVVMGHGLCGGVAAAFAAADEKPVGQFISPWVGLIADLCAEALEQREAGTSESAQKTAELMVIKRSLANLSSFPFVSDAVAAGRLRLHGAWFSIAEGQLQWLDPRTGSFDRISDG